MEVLLVDAWPADLPFAGVLPKLLAGDTLEENAGVCFFCC